MNKLQLRARSVDAAALCWSAANITPPGETAPLTVVTVLDGVTAAAAVVVMQNEFNE